MNLTKRTLKNVLDCIKTVKMCDPYRNIFTAFCFHESLGKSLTLFGRNGARSLAPPVLFLKVSYHNLSMRPHSSCVLHFPPHDVRWGLVFIALYMLASVVRFQAWTSEFSLLLSVQANPEAHPTIQWAPGSKAVRA
jgi:hypothetical protein